MDDEVSVDSANNAGIAISNLKRGRGIGVSGAAIDPDHIRHPPVAALFEDHCHARTDVEKHRIRFGNGFSGPSDAWGAESPQNPSPQS